MKVTTHSTRKPASIPHSRWASYATAGAAAAIGCAAPTQADLIYSGLVNHHFEGRSTFRFQLNQPGNSFLLSHGTSGFGVNGSAFFSLVPPIVSGAVAGFYGGYRQYASKLGFGQNISARPFVPRNGILAISYGQEGGAPYDAQWLEPGTGFVGFRFDGGSGLQYGWARIHADGQPGNSFTLIDYAFADPGERIRAGQTSASVPESGGSLGLLALGCAGLLAWRARRQQAEAS